jgi:hypothetical protein
MTKISYSGYRFPPEIIQHAIWLYYRFTLGFRDVEDLLAERGIIVSYETIRRWANHFGPTSRRTCAACTANSSQRSAPGMAALSGGHSKTRHDGDTEGLSNSIGLVAVRGSSSTPLNC